MVSRHGMQLTDDTFDRFNKLKIKLAGTIGNIPANSNILTALISMSDKHFDELVNTIKDNK